MLPQAAYDHRTILNMLIAANTAGAIGAGGSSSPLKTPAGRGLKPATPAPMTAAERAGVGKRLTRESFILSYTGKLLVQSGVQCAGRARGARQAGQEADEKVLHPV